jgi:hypothetical protein
LSSGPFGDIRLRVTSGTRRSLFVVHNLVVGFHYVVLTGCRLSPRSTWTWARLARTPVSASAFTASSGTGGLVEGRTGSLIRLVELVQGSPNAFRLTCAERLPPGF